MKGLLGKYSVEINFLCKIYFFIMGKFRRNRFVRGVGIIYLKSFGFYFFYLLDFNKGVIVY